MRRQKTLRFGLWLILTASANCSVFAAPAEETLYVVAPFSGSLADTGAQIRAGVDAAILNGASTADHSTPKIHVEYFDDGCQPEQAVIIARRLVAAHARVVLGHVCSVASMPASEIYAKAGIPMLSAASSNSFLTERGLNSVFRVAGRDDAQAPLAANTIATRFPGKPVTIVEEDDLTGKGHGSRVAAALKEKNVHVASVIDISGKQQVSSIVDQLNENRAEVVFYAGHQADQFGELLKLARQEGFHGAFFSNDGAGNVGVWKTAGAAAEGVMFTFDRDNQSAPAAAAAVKTLKTMGKEAGGFTLNAYASTQILVRVLRAIPSDDGEAISKYMHKETFDTAIGPVKFDKKGDPVESREEVFEWHDGAINPVQ